MPVSVKQLRDNQNNFIYPKIVKEGLVEPINGNDVGISAINGIQSSTVQGALNELAGNNVEIVKTASGSVISVSDSANYRLLGLKLYGKSVQDGTPTPESPVEIESAGDGGNVGVKIQGKNLIYTTSVSSSNGVTVSKNDDGTFILNGTVTGSNAGIYFYGSYNQPKQLLPNGSYKYKVDGLFDNDNYAIRSIDNSNQAQESNGDVLTYSYPIYQVVITLRLGNTYDNVIIKPMLVYGDDMPNEFVPGIEPQTLTYPTPNGLPGIPVESGGNYTDAEGQQWICDEVDFGRGKYIQRVRIRAVESGDSGAISTLTSNEKITRCYIKTPGKMPKNIGVRCNILSYSSDYIYVNIPENFIIDESSTNVLFAVSKSYGSTFEEIRQKLINAGAKILYVLATPLEINLSSEQLEAYAALATYKPNTTITTDSDPAAGIEVKYVADSGVSEVLDYYATTADVAAAYAKKALKFAGTFTAAGWTSATGGYSQTINVSGLTADDEPIIDLNSTAADADTFNGQLEAFGLVSNFTTGAGTLTAVVLGDSAPDVDIPIHGVVVY